MATIRAEPYVFTFDPSTVALIIIDMQRDFVYPGGFGEVLGNDTSLLLKAVAPTKKVLAAARKAGLYIIHTREGHRADLSDLWPAKKARGRLKTTIGDKGPMGRILVRGEHGHDIIDELQPKPGEPVVDKPGKGAFYATDLNELLKSRNIRQLIVCGVTTEVCVTTTVREANDRGYDCLVLEDCVASYFPAFQDYALRMIKAGMNAADDGLAGVQQLVLSVAHAVVDADEGPGRVVSREKRDRDRDPRIAAGLHRHGHPGCRMRGRRERDVGRLVHAARCLEAALPAAGTVAEDEPCEHRDRRVLSGHLQRRRGVARLLGLRDAVRILRPRLLPVLRDPDRNGAMEPELEARGQPRDLRHRHVRPLHLLRRAERG